MPSIGLRILGWMKIKLTGCILLFSFLFSAAILLNTEFITEGKQEKFFSIGVSRAPTSRSICPESY